jgi:membrane protein YdbS with pleckstrin-like domain
MKIYDEVMEKGGDLSVELGKTAVIAGVASLFVEKFNFITSVGTTLVGLLAIIFGLYLFHVRGRRREEAEKKDTEEIRKEQQNV